MSHPAKPRILSLESWLVRALIPERLIGTYVLYRDHQPIYAGRSDHDLRRRLVTHAYEGRADYFNFDIHRDPQHAFDIECAIFHALGDALENSIHPASPSGARYGCSVCSTIRAIKQSPQNVMNDVQIPSLETIEFNFLTPPG